MTIPLKTVALVLALTGSAGAVLAQTAPSSQTRGLAPGGGAAATLPNTFDGPPAAATPRATPPAATPPVATSPGTAAQVTDVQMAEAALRSVIEQFRAADIDEALFTPDVATQLNGELTNYSRMIRDYGAVRSIETQGAREGVGQFLVVFDNAATQWQVGLEEGGLVAALRFREAPPESSEPASARPASPDA